LQYYDKDLKQSKVSTKKFLNRCLVGWWVGLVSPFFCQSVNVCTVVRRVAPNVLRLGSSAGIRSAKLSSYG